MSRSAQRAKFETLFAVFERFYRDLENVRDPFAARLCENWSALKARYLSPASGVRRSQLTQGLEQGLREIPMLLRSLDQPHRSVAAKIYRAALEVECSAYLDSESVRLAKVVKRGRISSESEFHLVRYAIDTGSATDPEAAGPLHDLVEAFEAKGRREA